MEYCNDRHDLVYKIRYKPSNRGGTSTEWLVCENCFEKKVFGDENTIESITLLKTQTVSKVDIEKLSILTRKVTTKIRMLLFKH